MIPDAPPMSMRGPIAFLHPTGHLDLPAGDKELPETAHPITECDRMRSCAAPDPPNLGGTHVGDVATRAAPRTR